MRLVLFCAVPTWHQGPLRRSNEQKQQTNRVLVIDSSAFMRNRLSRMLMKCSNLEVVETAMNGHDAIEQEKRTQPDVMTLDIEMPSLNGFRNIRSYDG